MSNKNAKYQIYFLASGILLVLVTLGEYFGQSMFKLVDSGEISSLVNFSPENVIFLVHAIVGFTSIFFYVLLQRKHRYAVILWEKFGLFLFVFYALLFFLIDPVLEAIGLAPQ